MDHRKHLILVFGLTMSAWFVSIGLAEFRTGAAKTDRDRRGEEIFFVTIEHDHHKFVVSNMGTAVGSFIHHPDCPCLRVKPESKPEPRGPFEK